MTFHRQLAAIAIGLVVSHVYAAHHPNHGGGSTDDYTQPGLKVAPRRGTTGNANDGNIVYGPMENGFGDAQTSQQFGCTNGLVLAGGIDTRMAERMVHAQAALGNCNAGVSILNDCGGHAVPFHYHERMTCLHTNDPGTGHSTSVATMLDGKMLYGKWEDFNAVPPLAAYDLVDACNGHFGTNPDSLLSWDSPATEVYHYHVTDLAPFTVGCFGPAVDAGTDVELMVTIAMGRMLLLAACTHHLAVCAEETGDSSPGQALLNAVGEGDLATVKKLVANGVDVAGTANEWGETCLHLAAIPNDRKMLDYLIDQGADAAAFTDGAYPGHSRRVKRSVLQWFVPMCDLDTVEHLVLNGADVHFVNEEGETAKDMATGAGSRCKGVAEYLNQKMAATTAKVEL